MGLSYDRYLGNIIYIAGIILDWELRIEKGQKLVIGKSNCLLQSWIYDRNIATLGWSTS